MVYQFNFGKVQQSYGQARVQAWKCKRQIRESSITQAVQGFPDFIPEQVQNLKDADARALLQDMQRKDIKLDKYDVTISTSFVAGESSTSVDQNGSEENSNQQSKNEYHPIVFLHGFDSSSLEFRQLYKRAKAQGIPCYAVDLIGWGFTDHQFEQTPSNGTPPATVSPDLKREHLRAFHEQVIKQKMVLMGSSLGGTIAAEFATFYPDLVHSLVLFAPQLETDGLGFLPLIPDPILRFLIKFLRSDGLRTSATKQTFFAKDSIDTDECVRIGKLHTYLPGWEESNLAFINSGGYGMSERVSKLSVPVRLIWGADDEILTPSYGEQAMQLINDCKIDFLADCGHQPHLEQADAVYRVVEECARVGGGGIGEEQGGLFVFQEEGKGE